MRYAGLLLVFLAVGCTTPPAGTSRFGPFPSGILLSDPLAGGLGAGGGFGASTIEDCGPTARRIWIVNEANSWIQLDANAEGQIQCDPTRIEATRARNLGSIYSPPGSCGFCWLTADPATGAPFLDEVNGTLAVSVVTATSPAICGGLPSADFFPFTSIEVQLLEVGNFPLPAFGPVTAGQQGAGGRPNIPTGPRSQQLISYDPACRPTETNLLDVVQVTTCREQASGLFTFTEADYGCAVDIMLTITTSLQVIVDPARPTCDVLANQERIPPQPTCQ